MLEPENESSFPTTRWSVIVKSRDVGDTERRQALEEICRVYWPPVYAFLRSSGHPKHDAEDLTQGFFEQLLIRGGFDRTDPAKGRLRSYLLGALKHYVASEHRKTSRRKRGGGNEIISWDELEAEGLTPPELTDGLTPDKIYTRRWVKTLLDQVLDELSAHYAIQGKATIFEALKPMLTPGNVAVSYSSLAERLGMTESAVKVAAHRFRQRFGVLLRNTVAFTMEPGEDVDREVSELMASFD